MRPGILRISFNIVFAFRSIVKQTDDSLVKLHKNTLLCTAYIKLTAFLHFSPVQKRFFLIK